LIEGPRRDDGWATLSTMAMSVGRMEEVDFLVKKGARDPWEGGAKSAAECLLAASA